MKNIIMRLRCKKGESLIESMAAILIFTLASIIMLTMVTASADINKAAKEAEKVYHEQLIIAEKAEGTAVSSQVVFSISKADGSTDSKAVNVDVYAKDNSSLYAYYPQPVIPNTEVSGS